MTDLLDFELLVPDGVVGEAIQAWRPPMPAGDLESCRITSRSLRCWFPACCSIGWPPGKSSTPRSTAACCWWNWACASIVSREALDVAEIGRRGRQGRRAAGRSSRPRAFGQLDVRRIGKVLWSGSSARWMKSTA